MKFIFLVIVSLIVLSLYLVPVKANAQEYTPPSTGTHSGTGSLDCAYINQVIEKYYSTLRVNNKFSDKDYKRIIESRWVNYPVQEMGFEYHNAGKEIYLFPANSHNNKCALLFVTEEDGMNNYRGIQRLSGPADDPNNPSILLLNFKNPNGAKVIVIENDLSLTSLQAVF